MKIKKKETKKTVCFRLSEDHIAAIKKEAKQNTVTVTAVIEELVNRYLLRVKK